MDKEQYPIANNSTNTVFKFVSNGPDGVINKAIKYTVTKNPEIFNLGFGDVISISENGETIEVDDTVISGDRDLVLATVASSIYEFTKFNPDKYVIFRGSTASRTRLYRRAITLNHNEISKTFDIFGVVKHSDDNFQQVIFDSTLDCFAYLIKRK